MGGETRAGEKVKKLTLGTKRVKTIFRLFHCVAMALTERYLCFTNLEHQGTYGSSVALYGPAKNKEIVKSVRIFSSDTLKLREFLANVDIELPTDNRRRSVCKKCSRKVVDFYNLFNEIKNTANTSFLSALVLISNTANNLTKLTMLFQTTLHSLLIKQRVYKTL